MAKEYLKKLTHIIDQITTKKFNNIGLEIEKWYGFPQDIEFCIKNEKIFILQSRPLTTL